MKGGVKPALNITDRSVPLVEGKDYTVKYAGYKKGDFRIDGNTVIEVGGADKGFSDPEGGRSRSG